MRLCARCCIGLDARPKSKSALAPCQFSLHAVPTLSWRLWHYAQTTQASAELLAVEKWLVFAN